MTIIACPTCADVLAQAQAKNERLTKIAAAWKELAQAWRDIAATEENGPAGAWYEAITARKDALVTLRALGIDPEAP